MRNVFTCLESNFNKNNHVFEREKLTFHHSEQDYPTLRTLERNFPFSFLTTNKFILLAGQISNHLN